MTNAKKLSLILLIAVIAVVLWYAISLPKNQPVDQSVSGNEQQIATTQQIATSTTDKYEKPATSLFTGKLIDRDGDLIDQEITLFLISSSGWQQLGNKENEWNARDNSNYQFVSNNQSEFITEISNGEYYLYFGGYWKAEGDLTYVGPIRFQGEPINLKLKLREHGYEDKKDRFVYVIAKRGDTLWSIAEEYYGDGKFWPIMARLNDIDLSANKNVLIKAGDQIMLPKKTWYETDDVLNTIRESVYNNKLNSVQTYVNVKFNYSIKYPGSWIINENYDYLVPFTRGSELNKIEVLGPSYQPRMHSYSDYPVHVIIAVFDNCQQMSLEEFLTRDSSNFIDKSSKFAQLPMTSNGGYFSEGGVNFNYGPNHIFFLNNNKIYTLTFPSLSEVKLANERFYNELKLVIDSFSFLK